MIRNIPEASLSFFILFDVERRCAMLFAGLRLMIDKMCDKVSILMMFNPSLGSCFRGNHFGIGVTTDYFCDA